MNETDSIIDLLGQLYSMIQDARSVPLMGNDRCVIERNAALGLLQDLNNRLPKELEDARRLMARRDDYISNTKREGESIRRAAEERARAMVEDQEIVRAANAQAEQIIAAAQQKADELRRAANDYLDSTLGSAEQSLNRALDSVSKSRARFRSAAGIDNSKTAGFDDDLV